MKSDALFDVSVDTVDSLLDPEVWMVDVEEESAEPAAAGVMAWGRVSEALAMDADLDAGDLVEVLAHCQATVSAAQFRMVQAASLIHESRTLDYMSEVAELADADPSVLHGPDGLERAVADVGAALCVPARTARSLIEVGYAARYVLPATAVALSQGRIDVRRFEIVMRRTALVEPGLVEKLDCRVALAIAERDQMSVARFTALVDRIVAQVDPEALVRRRERAAADRGVSVRPDRFAPGQSRVAARLPSMDAAVVDARLSAMAAGVCAEDPRTVGQRRADALIALAAGAGRLACGCEECSTRLDDEADESAVQTDGELVSQAPVAGVSAVIHVIANQSTLDGDDDEPGYVDGHGVIDADSVRELALSAFTRLVGVDPQTIIDGDLTGSLRYRPGRAVQAFVRTGELCCTFPGCNGRVWTADLDHGVPFDHHDPGGGGPSVWWNLKPLCRFHHRIKTFTHWRDYQDPFGTVVFESPEGRLFFGNAFRGIDLFPGLKPRPPDHPARAETERRHTQTRGAGRRRNKRIDDADPPPF